MKTLIRVYIVCPDQSVRKLSPGSLQYLFEKAVQNDKFGNFLDVLEANLMPSQNSLMEIGVISMQSSVCEIEIPMVSSI